MRGNRFRAWGAGCMLAALAICHTAPARAQIAGALSLDSDYRLRGISLSGLRPALSLAATVEHPGGVYAGGSVVAIRAPGGKVRILGHMAQLGYAIRDAGGTSWDIGVSNTDVEVQGVQRFDLQYSDIHVGVSRDNLSARIYVSPNYQGSVKTAYLDLSATLNPAENWRISTHVGILKRLGSSTPRVSLRERYDVRVGLARDIGNLELRLEGVVYRSSPRPRAGVQQVGLIVGGSLGF